MAEAAEPNATGAGTAAGIPGLAPGFDATVLADDVATFDPAGRYCSVSPARARLRGLAVEDFLGRSPLEIAASVALPAGADRAAILARAEEFEATVREVARTGSRRSVEVEQRYADGSQHRVRTELLPEWGPDGRPSGVVSVSYDVTEWQRRLDETEQRYRLLAEQSADLVMLVRGDGRIEWASPSSRSILGREPEDLVGYRYRDLVHPDDARTAAERPVVLERDPQGRPRVLQAVLRVQRADHTWLFLDCRWSVDRDDAGRPVRFVVSAHDATERLESRRALAAHIALHARVTEGAVRLLHAGPDGLVAAVDEFLSDLGHALDLDRIWVGAVVSDEVGNLVLRASHRWSTGETSTGPIRPGVDAVHVEQALALAEHLARGETWIAGDVAALGPEWEQERALFAGWGIDGVVLVPLRDGAELLGVVAFERLGRTWAVGPDTVEVLRSVGEILSRALAAWRAAEALAEGEARYRGVFEAVREAVALIDLDTLRILDANAAALTLTGYDAEALSGLTLDRISDEPEATATSLAALLGGAEVAVPLRWWRHRSGHRIPVEVNAGAFTAGSRRLGVVVARDVSARLAADAELRASEARLRSLVAHLPVLVARVAADGVVRDVNEPVAAVARRPRALLVGRRLTEAGLPEATARTWSEAVARVVASGRSEESDVALPRPDGARWLHTAVVPEPGPDGVDGAVLVAVDVTDRRRWEDDLAHRATHDPLTGLPNRQALLERLSGVVAGTGRRDDPPALLYIDLDHLKPVNDRHGHHAGDAVLRTQAERLGNLLRAGDLPARVGGDEFAVLCEQGSGLEGARMLGERIVAALREPIVVDGQPCEAGASVGVVEVGPGDTPDRVLARADAAMYRAKRAGRGRVEVGGPDEPDADEPEAEGGEDLPSGAGDTAHPG